jgi:hypothetical protein
VTAATYSLNRARVLAAVAILAALGCAAGAGIEFYRRNAYLRAERHLLEGIVRVESGMTKEEVRALIGEATFEEAPISEFYRPGTPTCRDTSAEVSVYQPRRAWYVPEPRRATILIFFGETGRVTCMEKSKVRLMLTSSMTFNAGAVPVEVEIAVPVTASLRGASMTSDVTLVTPYWQTSPSRRPASWAASRSGHDHHQRTRGARGRAQLSTSDAGVVATPLQTAIPSGVTTHTTRLTTAPVAVPTPVFVSASRAGIIRSATVTVAPR